MTATRRSSRLAGQASSSPKALETLPRAGSKRKAGASPSQSKRSRKATKQQTIEETLPVDEPKDQEIHDEDHEVEMDEDAHGDVEKHEENAVAGAEKTEANGNSKHETSTSKPTNGDAIKNDPGRGTKVPSDIIEKGIIHFFTRGRVGVEEPEGVADLQRSYFVLRPLPKDAKIGDGPIPDSNKNRLIAVPKKVFPKSGRDRFMAFVEKAGVSMTDLKEDFFQGSEYETKTTGTHHTPPVTPIGEGVYAMMTKWRTSHLVYMLTIPQKPGEVQHDMGIREKGSFITSLKNPTQGPAYARLPQGPGFPESILSEFDGHPWMPLNKAEYLNYPNAQILLIGVSEDKVEGTLEPTDKDRHGEKETSKEELEKLEGEDQIRVERLHGDETVFDDLHVSKKEYPDVMTTW